MKEWNIQFTKYADVKVEAETESEAMSKAIEIIDLEYPDVYWDESTIELWDD